MGIALKSDVDVVQQALHGAGVANVDAVNEENSTALMFASEKNHLDSVRYLLDIKANVNHCSSKSGTAMHRAAACGCIEILKVIIRQ